MKPILYVILIASLLFGSTVLSQGYPTVRCGDSVTTEFTESFQTLVYSVALRPGDTIRVSANRTFDYLEFGVGSYTGIYAPSGSKIDGFTGSNGVISVSSGALGERGDYQIHFRNYEAYGEFQFAVSCTRDGAEFDESVTIQIMPTNQSDSIESQFSGIGFPGLLPVDFSSVARIPLTSDSSSITGAITTNGQEILGYTLDADTGSRVDLTINRLSGNLSIGVVVLSEDNKTIFQASLVTSTSLTTSLILPSSGRYTFGIFRIELVPLDNPEATAFELSVKLGG